jgi:hypothetical protein
VNFFTPKLIKIRCSSLFFGSFAHFQVKLSTHGSNPNSRFVSMSELEFILLSRVLTQNFNTMNLVNLHIQIIAVTLKVTPCRTMSQKKVKNSENPRFHEQNKKNS